MGDGLHPAKIWMVGPSGEKEPESFKFSITIITVTTVKAMDRYDRCCQLAGRVVWASQGT